MMSKFVTLEGLIKDLAKAEPEKYEYEFIGCINGAYAGRWMLTVEDKAAVWPKGTAVYVRRVSPSKIGEQLGEQLGEQELKANVTAKFLEWHAEVVKLAVTAEREACAQLAADQWLLDVSPEQRPGYRFASNRITEKIRARGNT